MVSANVASRFTLQAVSVIATAGPGISDNDMSAACNIAISLSEAVEKESQRSAITSELICVYVTA